VIPPPLFLFPPQRGFFFAQFREPPFFCERRENPFFFFGQLWLMPEEGVILPIRN